MRKLRRILFPSGLPGRGASPARVTVTALVVLLAITSGACNNSSDTTTAPTPSLTYVTEVFTNTVDIPKDGVLQVVTSNFTVQQSGGNVTITLTSAVETLPGGSLLTNVTMGLGVGTLSNGVCTVSSTSFTTAQGSSSPQLSGANIGAGAYCVQVSDVTNQTGPVAFALVITHA
jgi:hypothetical protein